MTSEMQHERDELLDLLARNSYLERELKLASGRPSNYYIDCKRTLYLPRGAVLAGELMLQMVLELGIEQVGGIATGAIPLTDAVINAAGRCVPALTGFFVRKEIKPHGLQQRVEGALRSGRRTAIIDDTITTGGSSLVAVQAARETGAEVVAVMALVDRNEGAAQAFAAQNLEYRYLFAAEEIRRRAAQLAEKS